MPEDADSQRSTDPSTFFREWYNATSEAWSKAAEEAVGSEQFMELNKRFLESYATFSKAWRLANEEYFRNLQLPTRSDITRVAELVVALEEKIDRIEDTLEDRLDRVESKLDGILAALEKPQTRDSQETDLSPRKPGKKKSEPSRSQG